MLKPKKYIRELKSINFIYFGSFIVMKKKDLPAKLEPNISLIPTSDLGYCLFFFNGTVHV